MTKIDLNSLTVENLSAQLRVGAWTAKQLTEAYLQNIKERNPKLNAYLEVFDDAIMQAEEVDRRLARGESLGPLAGLPLAVKDNILIKGRRCSSASKMLENYQAVYSATVIKKLKQQGVVFLGRTNMDEFAMGGSTENSAFGPTRNPVDDSRVPGGSSGGSASAVGGGLALAALGSDTGGSIRQPSSFCGTVGLKPTYGAVSRYGLMAMASSLDQIGPISKTVADAEIIFQAIRGRDSADATSSDQPATISATRRKIIGVPYHFLRQGVAPEVLDNFQQTIDRLRATGYQIEEISLPNLHYSLSCYYVLMPAEASTNLARFDGMRYGLYRPGRDGIDDYLASRGAGFGREVRRRIILGTYVLSAGYYDAYYGKALAVRRLIEADYRQAFDRVDAILTPTAPTPAFPLGEKTSDPLQMYLEDIFTVPVNLAGVPAMSVPTGRTSSGLPIGTQITAPHWREDILFALGREIFTAN